EQTKWKTAEAAGKGQTAASVQFCRLCGCWRGSLGLEPTPDCGAWAQGNREPYISWEFDHDTQKEEPVIRWRRTEEIKLCGACYICHLVAIFREVRRVLRDDGTLWLNIAGCYASQGGPEPAQTKWQVDGASNTQAAGKSRKAPKQFKPKDWVPIPWMLGMALQADGWWLRSPIIWAKGLSFCESYSGSSMPESVRSRPSNTHEYLLLLTKSARYFYDKEAVAEESVTNDPRKPYGSDGAWLLDGRDKWEEGAGKAQERDASRRNLRSVWAINPESLRQKHYASFPTALVEPCIKAGTSERGCCPKCGKGWERIIERTGHINKREPAHQPGNDPTKTDSTGWAPTSRATENWRPGCECCIDYSHTEISQEHLGPVPYEPVPCIVLDPFCGSGTTVMVALRLGRRAIGIDLSETYCEMARQRVIDDCPMLNTPEEAT
ncbi:MAG TPA: site-specific DNA-methyltransferase, partial [Phycisphaerae bacterium]|nr:site-specific DNA-methyltransferase [Phycisphaerae bacterium]